jgi:hypothetical protein
MRHFQIDLTEPRTEVLREVSRAWGETPERYIQSAVMEALQSDIDLMFGNSKAIAAELNQKLGPIEELEQ